MCGVPQGSILGPILFNLYVTDMSTFTSSTCLHFADDTTLYKRCKVKDIPDCTNIVQNDVEYLKTWSDVNSLLFNGTKTNRGGSRDFEKGRGGALCRPPWLVGENVLCFRWSKKAKITLETISFRQNIYISISKFSPFLLIKSYNFSNFTNTLIRKEKKHFFLFLKLIRSAIFAF